MVVISSHSNAKIKQARALRQRKARQESGLFLVEGLHHIGEAIAALAAKDPGRTKPTAGVQLEYLIYAPELLESQFGRDLVHEVAERGLACFETTPEVLETIAEKENPQGVLAVMRQPVTRLSALDPLSYPWLVALVAPQDPGNVGSILRTIDAVGASGLLVLDSSVDPYHPSAVRASMGTLFWHPIVQASFQEFAAWAGEHGYSIIGTSAQGSQDYRSIENYTQPLVLLMGSEREGLTSEQADLCSRLVRLPMLGRASSLNLSVATGVMLYTILEYFNRE